MWNQSKKFYENTNFSLFYIEMFIISVFIRISNWFFDIF